LYWSIICVIYMLELDPSVILALVMLSIGSYMDLRYREVPDLLWIVAIVVGIIVHVMIQPSQLLDNLSVILITSVTVVGISLIAYRLGLFGGADMLALIALVIILPIHENSYTPALSTFINACILAVITAVPYNVVKNASMVIKGVDIFKGFNEPLSRKLLAFMIAQRVDKVGRHYAFIAERDTMDGKRFDLSIKDAEHSSYAELDEGRWVIVGLPFILYILVGFVLMLFLDNILIFISKI